MYVATLHQIFTIPLENEDIMEVPFWESGPFWCVELLRAKSIGEVDLYRAWRMSVDLMLPHTTLENLINEG